jgi:4-hydroxy-3-methylbut-2-enyl diphosphate reductase
MNRSVLLETFHSSREIADRGTVTVATSWSHPQRGPVTCPAHPLLTASAGHAGFNTVTRALTTRDLRHRHRPGPSAASTVFAASYENPTGGVVGFAVAAHPADRHALAFAREEVAAWRTVLRTRRLLHTSHPHSAPHTERQSAAAALPSQGRDGRPSRWRACGCPVTTACPAVDNAVSTIQRFQSRGDEVVLIGRSPLGPLPLPPTLLQAPPGLTVCETADQAETLTLTNPGALAFVMAPGAVTSQTTRILAILRRRFPRLRGQHPDQWCYTATDLHDAARSVMAESDVLLVVGQGHSPASTVLSAEAVRAGIPVHRIESLTVLRPQHIDASTVALVEAEATPPTCTTLSGLLAGLGPWSTIHRELVSRVTTHTPATHPANR